VGLRSRWWHKEERVAAKALVPPLRLHQMPEECYEPILCFLTFPGTDSDSMAAALDAAYGGGKAKALGACTLDEAVKKYRAHTYFEQHLFRVIYGHMPLGLERRLQRRMRYVTLLGHPIEMLMNVVVGKTPDAERPAAVKKWLRDPDPRMLNVLTRYLAGDDRLLKGGRPTKKSIEQAKHHLATHFTAIGFSDDLKAMLACCKERFSWPRMPPLLPRLLSPFVPEGRLKARLEKLLRPDLELFEFAKTLVGATMTVPESPRTPDLSVIFGTYNRIWHLTRCIASLRQTMGGLSYELVVCDAGSTDGSREWLAAQPDVVLLGERVREGAVKAFNKGFHVSRGHAVAYWNDDVVAVDKDAMARAVSALYEPGVGQVACPFNVRDNTNMSLEHVHGKPFANLGIVTRTLAEAIIEITGGLWSPCYHTYGADTELSCWVHKLGLRVLRPEGSRWSDLRVNDGLRSLNNQNAKADNQLFWRRWKDEDMLRPDGPDPNVTRAELARFHAVRARGVKIERKPGRKAEPPPAPMPTPPLAAPSPPPKEEPKEPKEEPVVRRDSQTVLIRDGHLVEGPE
jgi:hypothetical protein